MTVTRTLCGPLASSRVSTTIVGSIASEHGTTFVYGSLHVALAGSTSRSPCGTPSTSSPIDLIPPPLSVALKVTYWMSETGWPEKSDPVGGAVNSGSSVSLSPTRG